MVPTLPVAPMRWIALALAVVALDQVSKAAIQATFRPGDELALLPFLSLVLTFNTGAAFSFLAGAGGWQRWFFTIVAIAISIVLVVMLRRPHRDKLVPFALALVLGGAIGNLWDRVTLGHVVDFIQLHAGGYYWPAFNVADSAITVGVALLLWDGLRGGGKAQTKASP